MLTSIESVEPGLKSLSRKKAYSKPDELQAAPTLGLLQGTTGDGKVGVIAGSGEVRPSGPMRKAVAGVDAPCDVHVPELVGLRHETGCRKPSPRTGVDTWSMPRFLV